MELSASETRLMTSDPQKAAQKLATTNDLPTEPTKYSSSALMTSVNSPSVRITSGSESSQSSGRRSTLRMPSSSDAPNNAMMLLHSMPGTVLAATMTAKV